MFSAANYVTGVNAVIPKTQMFNPAPAKWSVFSSKLSLNIQIDDPQSIVKHKLRSKLTAIPPGALVPEILWY